MKIKANIFLEYTIILGIISAVLFGMNTYMKRGFQAKIKDMTDHFINNDQEVQVVQVNPMTSNSNTTSQTNINSTTYIGGGTQLAMLDTKNFNAASRLEEREPFFAADFTPWQNGTVITPIRGNETQYVNSTWRTEQDIRILEGDRDRLRREADMLDAQAAQVENQGQSLIDQANHMSCPSGKKGNECRAGRDRLRNQGQNLLQQANNIRQQATDDRAEADRIQAQIDQLRRG